MSNEQMNIFNVMGTDKDEAIRNSKKRSGKCIL